MVAATDHRMAMKICALRSLQDPTACFPYLPRGTMTEAQFSMLKARLDEETKQIKLKFASLMFNLQRDLESTLPLGDLVKYLVLYDTSYERVLGDCSSFDAVFLKLRKLAVNFFDYELLQQLIVEFGSVTIKETLEEYKGCFIEYSRRLVRECPSNTFDECEPSENNLVLVAGKDFDTLTLDALKKFELKVNTVLGNQFVMMLCVKKESICITFRMFENKNFSITEEQRQALQRESVLSITYGDQCFDILQKGMQK